MGIRAGLRIAKYWGLTDTELGQLLGERSARTIRRWRAILREGVDSGLPTEDDELHDRLSLILGIYKALHTLFSDDDQADEWIRRPNSAPVFEGQSALAMMLAGGLDSMWEVRRYLKAATS